MRMIDADYACKGCVRYRSSLSCEECVVNDAPTVDVVPVVRCRECIAYTPVDDNTGKCVFLIGEHQYVVPDGYCYLGERKEGADDAADCIRYMDAADVAQVRHGRWVHICKAIVDTTGDCSACYKEAVWRTRNNPYGICPNCGAIMDLEG